MTDTPDFIEDRYGIDIAADTSAMNATIEGLLRRRVCRNFADKEIDDGLLNLLLACAQSAPTKSNLQQYSIIAVRDQDTRQKIADLVPSMPWMADAPVFLVFLGDVRRIRRLADSHDHDYANNNADTFMNACVDAALAMQMFIVAAESAGLGCCPISYVRNRIDDFAELLSLPDGVFPIAGLPVGWPAAPGYVSMRLPQNVVVHGERYDDANMVSNVTDYDDRNHDRFPLSAGKQRHTDKYGVLEKCTWSENVARQLSMPERPGFAVFLKSKGINLD
ncbi:MAG: NADPH-dependent oxidoreductase [Rhodospirillaceae bacterium]|nr:NADPH-dependent oxidoreductase [Rhodospirillaceae bacterium]